MIREYSQNIIDHIKEIHNEKNKIGESYKRELIEPQQNTGKENDR